jgi:hypothetical protein
MAKNVAGFSEWRSASVMAVSPIDLRGVVQTPKRDVTTPLGRERRQGARLSTQAMAGHESPRTTKLYDRKEERLTQDGGEANQTLIAFTS